MATNKFRTAKLDTYKYRATVEVILGVLDDYMAFVDIEDVVRHARERIDANQEPFDDILLRVEVVHGYYDDHDVKIQIIGRRKETDEEMRLREQQDRQTAAQRIGQLQRQINQLQKQLAQEQKDAK